MMLYSVSNFLSFLGSTLQPLFRYILNAKFGINPLDIRGQNIAK